MEQQDEITVIEISADSLYQQDKATIDVQIATAKAYPRNIKRSVENAIAIVTMDKETAASCTYALHRGGKPITGPSVHLARIIVQVWGNMRIEAKVVSVDQRTITSQGIAFDLESNVAIKVEVKRSIMTKSGRMTDDMIVVTGNAGNSIALRNAVFNVIPKSVVSRIQGEAQSLLIGDVSDKTKLIATRKKILDGFKDTYGLKEDEILSAIGKSAVDHLTPDDLVTLTGIGQAIKDGDTSVDEAFRSKPKTAAERKAELKAKADAAKAEGKAGDQSTLQMP